MSFRITGLRADAFLPWYGQPEAVLRAHGIERVVADRPHAFPDRIELRDAEPGETLLLLNHVHQPADNAYRASHAIFVREGATACFDRCDEVPDVLRIRPLSVRAFDAGDRMVDADLVDGHALEPLLERLLGAPRTRYLQVHYARRGCYAARVVRA